MDRMMTNEEIVNVVTGEMVGKEIEIKERVHGGVGWRYKHKDSHWNFSGYIYRVKPITTVSFGEAIQEFLKGHRIKCISVLSPQWIVLQDDCFYTFSSEHMRGQFHVEGMCNRE